MKKFVLLFCSATLIFSMAACSGGDGKGKDNKDGKENKDESASMEGMKEMSLKEYGFPLKIMVPKENSNKGIPPAKAEFNGATGKLEIKAGERFQVAIFEKARPLDDIKKELEEDLMYENSFLTDEADKLVYKSKLPDDSDEFFHFYLEGKVDGQEYVVRSLKTGEFTKPQVEQMVKAAESLKKASEKKAS